MINNYFNTLALHYIEFESLLLSVVEQSINNQIQDSIMIHNLENTKIQV